ncbi:hypothetical protein LOK49_LG12G02443, partial [Camellia lanceoleosa]
MLLGNLQDGHPQITERELTSANDGNVAKDLMQNHDVFSSTLRSYLTKLQVVRHFWERNNIKGAIDATRKLPDHSVQADLISILMENRDSHLRHASHTRTLITTIGPLDRGGLKTHSQCIVPIQITQPSPTGIQA